MTACAMAVSIREKFPFELGNKLWRWLNDPRDFNFDDFGPRNYSEFTQDFVRRLAVERTWAILADGEVIGYLAFARQSPIAGQFNGMVISKEYRGQGIGKEALKQAIEQVSADGFVSLVSMPFWDNAAITRVLRQCGFREVGFLYQATKRNGKLDAVRIMQCQGGQ